MTPHLTEPGLRAEVLTLRRRVRTLEDEIAERQEAFAVIAADLAGPELWADLGTEERNDRAMAAAVARARGLAAHYAKEAA